MNKQVADELINEMLHPDTPDERREEIALALESLGDDTLPRLRTFLRSDDADHRWWSARALAALNTPSAAPLLIETLSDPDPDVRACAALGLGTLAASEAAAPLARLLADESAYVSRIASNALIQIGAPAVPALIKALLSASSAARAGAARAFIPLAANSHDAIPALFAALDDDSALVAHYAQEALWRMGVGIVLVKP